ncbi:MAG TPA: AtpZ/AtpI family protein [Bryobacteraceae bacterium]|nr:AtpZ/AtpI family protein [Bryobacteraceae bacterium]
MTGDKNNAWNAVARYASVAMLLPASAFVGYAIGYGLDYLFSTRFLGVTFLLLGVASGLVQVIRELSRDLLKNNGPRKDASK